jgi:hypothetical protein
VPDQLFNSQQLVSNAPDLTTRLLMPVQLLPRYLQVLQDFTKYTNDSHEDDAALQTATAHLSRVAASVRSHVYGANSIGKLKLIQRSIEPSIEVCRRLNRWVENQVGTTMLIACIRMHSY